MKKTATLLLALVLVCSFLLAGCDRITSLVEDVTAFSLVKNAVEKTAELDSAQIKMTINMKMGVSGMTMEIPVVMELQMSDLKSDKPVGSGKMTAETFIGNTEEDIYFDKEYVYTDQDGTKLKIQRNSEDASQYTMGMDVNGLLKELPEDVLKDVAVVKNDNGSKTVSVDISKEVFDKLFEELSKELTGGALEDLGEGLEDAVKMETSDFHVDITVLENGYVGSYGLSFKMKTEITAPDENGEEQTTSVNYDIAMTAEFIDPGKEVTVTPPADLDEYIDYDEYIENLLGDDDLDFDWDETDGDDYEDEDPDDNETQIIS